MTIKQKVVSACLQMSQFLIGTVLQYYQWRKNHDEKFMSQFLIGTVLHKRKRGKYHVNKKSQFLIGTVLLERKFEYWLY